MNTLQIIYLVLIFLTVFVVALVILTQFTPKPLQDRLQILKTGRDDKAGSAGKTEVSPWLGKIVELAKPMARLSVPKEGWENSTLRIHFMNAGYRSETAPTIFFLAKTLLTFTLPALLVL